MSTLFQTTGLLLMLLSPLPELWVGEPPVELSATHKGGTSLVIGEGEYKGHVSYDRKDKYVSFRWAYRAGTKDSFSRQEETTPFWPTEVESLGPDRLCVAGKRRIGYRTVIQIWTMPSPGLVHPYLDQETGQIVYPDVSIPITSKTDVYDEATVGRDMVKFMWQLRGTVEEAILVQFYDSGDVYALQLSSGNIALVASPDPNSGGIHIPALSRDYTQCWGAEHVFHGYIYVFKGKATYAGGATNTVLVMKDNDKNGTIDSWQEVSPIDWSGLGFSNRQNYLDVWD